MHTILSLRVTSHTRLKVCDHCILNLSLVQKAKTLQVHFTPEGEGLRVQRNYHECKLYMIHASKLWIMFHAVPEFALSPPPRGRPDANSCRPCQLNNWCGLWMRVKDPHNDMVTALGSCVK